MYVFRSDQELILIRTNTDVSALIKSNAKEETIVILNKIVLKVPYVSLFDEKKLKYLQYIERVQDFPMAFRI